MPDRNDDPPRPLVRPVLPPFTGPARATRPGELHTGRAVAGPPVPAPFSGPTSSSRARPATADEPGTGPGIDFEAAGPVVVPDDDLPLIDTFLLPDDGASGPGALEGAAPAAISPESARAGDEGILEESHEAEGVSFSSADGSVPSHDVASESRLAARPSPSAVEWPEDVWGAEGAEQSRQPAGRAEGSSPALLTGRFDEDAAVVGTIGQGRNRAEPLADALVSVAERIRSGELVAPGYDEGMSEAAALAAALAAVLGVRS